MKKAIFLFLVITALFSLKNSVYAGTTYYWSGSSGSTWASSANWINQSTYTHSGYPGSSGTTDVAYFIAGTTVSYTGNLSINYIQTSYLCGNVTISFTGTTPTLAMTTFNVGQQSSAAVGLTFTGTGTATVSSSPTFNYLAGFAIGSGATVTFSSGCNVGFNNPPAFTNAGTLNLNNATFTYSVNSITNSGTLNVTGSSAYLSTSAAFTSTGTINCTTGYISVTGNFSNSGPATFSNSSATATSLSVVGTSINSSSMSFTNGTATTGGSFTNSGTIGVSSGATWAANGSIVNSGSITVSSSTLTLGQSATLTNSGTITSTSPSTTSKINLTANSTGIITSGFVTATSTTFTLSAYPSYITNTGSFTSNGCTFNISPSSSTSGISNYATFKALSGTQINLTGQGTFILNSGSSGSFTLDASTISMSGANTINITNQTGAVFLANDNSTISESGYQDYIKNSSSFTAGTSGSPCIINISGTANSIGSGACSIYNTGTFNLGSTSIINATGTDPSNPTIVYNTGGTFTLMSDPNGSATIGTLGVGASFQGLFNVQRYVTGGGASYRNYRLFSCPVNKNQYTSSSTNAIDLSYLGQSVTTPSTFNGAYIAGPGSGFGSTPLHKTTFPIMYLYQESILPGSTYNSSFTSGKNIGIYSIGTNSVTTISTAAAGTTTSDNSSGVIIPPGNGYILYYIGSNQRTSTSAAINPDNSTITATGYINQGSVPLYMWGLTPTTALTKSTGTGNRYPGITEVGNPYASTIDLYTVYNDNSSGISPSFYELDGVNQAFDTYNASTGSSTSTPYRYIASGQGFYITASAAGSTLTFKEDQKTASSTSAVYPSANLLNINPSKGPVTDAMIATKHTDALPSSITPTAQDPAGIHLKFELDSVAYDEIGVYFSNAWSDKYDSNDSYDLDGLNPKVYLSSFTSDSVRTSINAMSSYTTGKRVRLYVRAVADGSYTLSMEDFLNIDTSLYNVYLVDNQQSDSVNLITTKSYTFSAVTADTSAYSNRFVLAVELKNLPAYQLTAFTGQKVTAGVQLNWVAVNASNYTGFVLQKQGAGNTYSALYTIQSDSATNYSYVDQHPTMGANVYRLQQSDVTGKITYSAPVTIGYSSTSPNGDLTVYPNPAKSTINVNLTSNPTNASNYTAEIYNSSGVIVGHQAVTGSKFSQDVSDYKLGIYVVQLKDANGYVLGTSKFVKVN